MITKTEFKTGLKHCPVALFHPSLIPKFITSGRRGVLKGIVNISIKQGLKYALPININCLNHSSMKTLMGKIGGYSQEYLYWLVRIQKPKVVVETGVYRGISSAFILAALHDNGEGKLYSIDLPNARYVGDSGIEDFSPLFAKETTGFAVPESLKDRWN